MQRWILKWCQCWTTCFFFLLTGIISRSLIVKFEKQKKKCCEANNFPSRSRVQQPFRWLLPNDVMIEERNGGGRRSSPVLQNHCISHVFVLLSQPDKKIWTQHIQLFQIRSFRRSPVLFWQVVKMSIPLIICILVSFSYTF
jgi:hypothetical protein